MGELYIKLKGKPCKPFGSDMCIHISENTLFTYPDISIICGDIISAEEDEDTAQQKITTVAKNSNCTGIYLL